MNWSDGSSFGVLVMALIGFSAIISSIVTIKNGIKQLRQPITDLENKVEAYEKRNEDIHMKQEIRISNLEERMNETESDREHLHKVNKLTLKALQALLSNDSSEIGEASKEIKDFMTNESA